MKIYSRNIVTEQGIIDGYLTFEDGKISDLVRKEVEQQEADLDFSEHTIIPGYPSLCRARYRRYHQPRCSRRPRSRRRDCRH